MPASLEKSIEYYQKAALANCPRAQLKLALLYHYGLIAPSDNVSAVGNSEYQYWLSKAVDAGDNLARYEFDRANLVPSVHSILLNTSQIVIHLDYKLDSDYDSRFPIVYHKKKTVQSNYSDPKSITYFVECGLIANEYSWKDIESIFNGINQKTYTARKRDVVGAIQMFNAGYDKYAFEAGMYYLTGNQTGQDYRKAFKCFEKAADYNNPEALFLLGYLYQCGYGVSKSESKAKELYSVAYHEYGHIKSALMLLRLEILSESHERPVVSFKKTESTHHIDSKAPQKQTVVKEAVGVNTYKELVFDDAGTKKIQMETDYVISAIPEDAYSDLENDEKDDDLFDDVSFDGQIIPDVNGDMNLFISKLDNYQLDYIRNIIAGIEADSILRNKNLDPDVIRARINALSDSILGDILFVDGNINEDFIDDLERCINCL